jgi:hypothetical protein
VFLLLRKFSLELETEVEVFLMILLRLIGEDTADGPDQQHHIHSLETSVDARAGDGDNARVNTIFV